MSGAYSGESSGDDETAGASERVAMVYDESGKAVPIAMKNFYYDSYQAPEEVEEEVDDRHASDTENANKPAAFSMVANSDSDEETSELEEESETDDDDQFMRIQVAAAPVKAVKKVRQDVDHDKPNRGRPPVGSGMKRAMSSVKLPSVASLGGSSGGASAGPESSAANPASAKERAAAARTAMKGGNGGRQSIGSVGRLLSFTKEKKQQQAGSPPAGDRASTDIESDKLPVAKEAKGRERESASNTGGAKPQKRQGLASVGRLLSISKRREDIEPAEIISIESPTAVTGGVSGPRPVGSLGGVANNDAFGERGRSEKPGAAGKERTNGGLVPRRSVGQQKMGRVASFSRKAPAQEGQSEKIGKENTEMQFNAGRERREAEKPGGVGLGSRMGVKQVGRMLSMSKKPAGPQAARQASFSSSKSWSTRSKESETGERDRRPPDQGGLGGGNGLGAKQNSRMSLKAAGRMLSFSRKPSAEKVKNGETGGNEGGDRATPSSGSSAVASQIQVNAPQEGSLQLDARANKFFFSEIRSEVCKSSALFSGETHIRVPVLVMAEYSGPVSKNKWFIDAFTLPHNAFRRECIDLYDIIMALARCSDSSDMTRADVQAFHAWWAVAAEFFKRYFDMERTVLFPWVDAAGARDWELQMALGKMRAMRDGLEAQLDGVSAAWAGLHTAPVGDVFCAVYRAVDAFCPRMMNYFSDQELLLPQIVKGFYRIEDRIAMDKDMLAVYMGETLTRKNKEAARHNVVLLVRWISNPRQLRAWLSKNLNSTGRASYGGWHAKYESEHSRYVKGFRAR